METILMIIAGLYLWIASWFSSQPEIIRDMPRPVAEIEPAFAEHVSAAFPPKTPLDHVISELLKQGFSIDAGGSSASFVEFDLVCRKTWTVTWQADAAVIAKAEGRYRATCL